MHATYLIHMPTRSTQTTHAHKQAQFRKRSDERLPSKPESSASEHASEHPSMHERDTFPKMEDCEVGKESVLTSWIKEVTHSQSLQEDSA